jgi:hypothetical protein
MKVHDVLEMIRGRPTLFLQEHQLDSRSVTNPSPQAATGADRSPASSPSARHATQTERAVMHPDDGDLEWSYCRGGWLG